MPLASPMASASARKHISCLAPIAFGPAAVPIFSFPIILSPESIIGYYHITHVRRHHFSSIAVSSGTLESTSRPKIPIIFKHVNPQDWYSPNYRYTSKIYVSQFHASRRTCGPGLKSSSQEDILALIQSTTEDGNTVHNNKSIPKLRVNSARPRSSRNFPVPARASAIPRPIKLQRTPSPSDTIITTESLGDSNAYEQPSNEEYKLGNRAAKATEVIRADKQAISVVAPVKVPRTRVVATSRVVKKSARSSSRTGSTVFSERKGHAAKTEWSFITPGKTQHIVNVTEVSKQLLSIRKEHAEATHLIAQAYQQDLERLAAADRAERIKTYIGLKRRWWDVQDSLDHFNRQLKRMVAYYNQWTEKYKAAWALATSCDIEMIRNDYSRLSIIDPAIQNNFCRMNAIYRSILDDIVLLGNRNYAESLFWQFHTDKQFKTNEQISFQSHKLRSLLLWTRYLFKDHPGCFAIYKRQRNLRSCTSMATDTTYINDIMEDGANTSKPPIPSNIRIDFLTGTPSNRIIDCTNNPMSTPFRQFLQKLRKYMFLSRDLRVSLYDSWGGKHALMVQLDLLDMIRRGSHVDKILYLHTRPFSNLARRIVEFLKWVLMENKLQSAMPEEERYLYYSEILNEIDANRILSSFLQERHDFMCFWHSCLTQKAESGCLQPSDSWAIQRLWFMYKTISGWKSRNRIIKNNSLLQEEHHARYQKPAPLFSHRRNTTNYMARKHLIKSPASNLRSLTPSVIRRTKGFVEAGKLAPVATNIATHTSSHDPIKISKAQNKSASTTSKSKIPSLHPPSHMRKRNDRDKCGTSETIPAVPGWRQIKFTKKSRGAPETMPVHNSTLSSSPKPSIVTRVSRSPRATAGKLNQSSIRRRDKSQLGGLHQQPSPRRQLYTLSRLSNITATTVNSSAIQDRTTSTRSTQNMNESAVLDDSNSDHNPGSTFSAKDGENSYKECIPEENDGSLHDNYTQETDESGSGLDEKEDERESLVPAHIPLKFQIPLSRLKDAMSASRNSGAAYWCYDLYRDGNDQKPVVHYCRSKHTAERELRQHFINQKILGFDIEWKPNAKSDDGIKTNVSLIQLASDGHILLVHVALFKETTSEELLPPILREIIESPNVIKAGVAITADCTRLRRYLGIKAQGLIELSHLYKLVKFSSTYPQKVNKVLVSMAKQVEEHLQLPLAKGSVRESDWSKPLDYEQVRYAASDAYAGLRMFDILEIKRLSLSPRPPRPSFAELNQPIKLVKNMKAVESQNGADQATNNHTEPPLLSDSLSDIGEEYETAPEEVDDLDEISPIPFSSPNPGRVVQVLNGARQKLPQDISEFTSVLSQQLPSGHEGRAHDTPSSEITYKTEQLLKAEKWAKEWLISTPKDKKYQATKPQLRAYSLWKHQNLHINEVASILRNPPLALSTTSGYILDSILYEKLEFDVDRVAELFDEIPQFLVRGKYRTILGR